MNKLLIVTGLSGAGRSSSLKFLEDLSFEVFDNFPIPLINDLIKQSDNIKYPIAIGVDSRTREFSPESVINKISELKSKGIDIELLFINCDEETLQRRFTETRRTHPNARERPISDGIRMEINLLASLQNKADIVIDTSNLSIHDLRRFIESQYSKKNNKNLVITTMSFGFKHGIPREADIMLDVRFLKNPHWEKELRHLRGIDKEVGDYISSDKMFEPFMGNVKNLIKPLLPKFKQEGKNYLTIAFGCTGGHHRSVFCAKTLKRWIEDQGLKTHIIHRDINM